MCGGGDFTKQDGMYVCQHCNTKYTTEEARKLFIEIDNTSKIDNLLKVARQAQSEGNLEQAGRYYDMVLQERADNWEAAFYTVYDTAMRTNIAGISSAAYSIARCLPNVLRLLKECHYEKEEEQRYLSDLGMSISRAGSTLYVGAMNHYKQHKDVANTRTETKNRVDTIIEMLFFTGDCFESYSDMNDPFFQTVTLGLWEEAITCFTSALMGTPKNLETYVAKIRKYKPDYKILGDNNSGGCYIATCVYGSYDCPPVWTLRRFRDNTLAKTWYGRAFIKAYYAVSPKLVKYFGDTAWFKRFWKVWLDRMVRSLQRNGFDSAAYIDK